MGFRFRKSLKRLNPVTAERSRSEEILNKALARKVLEQIMSREPSYPGLNERLGLLNA